jgi:hypothetical protein
VTVKAWFAVRVANPGWTRSGAHSGSLVGSAGVIQLGRLEALDAERGVQDRERHAPAVSHVLGEVDRRTRAASKRFLEEVAAGQGVGQPVA